MKTPGIIVDGVSAIFGLLMFARSQMVPVDIAELQRARYSYKGA